MVSPIPSTYCGVIIGWICSTACSIIALIYGIFALIPTAPFTEKNLSVGVTLIVLSLLGIIGIVAYLVGMLIGCLICAPCSACMSSDADLESIAMR